MSDKIEVGVKYDDRIKERFAGVLEGTPKIGNVGVSTISDDTPGAETIAELRERVSHFFDDISRAHESETVVVVAHGGSIKMLMSVAHGVPWEEIKGATLPHAEPFSEL